MLANRDAATEITAFRWVPDFAAGLVRDLRIRWALEEVGRDYRVRAVRPAWRCAGRLAVVEDSCQRMCRLHRAGIGSLSDGGDDLVVLCQQR